MEATINADDEIDSLLAQLQKSAKSAPTPPKESHVTLTEEEQQLVEEINQIRSNPSSFALFLERERKPYFDGQRLERPHYNYVLRTREGVNAVNEAISALRETNPLPKLKLSMGLCKAALDAGEEVGPTGGTACRSIPKMKPYGYYEGQVAEMASYGPSGRFDAKEIVSRFLIGDGNPGREHQKNILSQKYVQIGVAVVRHQSNFERVTVVNFAENFTEK